MKVLGKLIDVRGERLVKVQHDLGGVQYLPWSVFSERYDRRYWDGIGWLIPVEVGGRREPAERES